MGREKGERGAIVNHTGFRDWFRVVTDEGNTPGLLIASMKEEDTFFKLMTL